VFRLSQQRGKLLHCGFGRIVATVHPSSILRAQDDEERRIAMRAFVDELRGVAGLLKGGRQPVRW
jgi:DNA polymerase